MKTFKFALAMLAASMMSTSELAMAATDQAVKKEYNKYLKEQLMADGANMNSFYQSNKDLMQ